MGGYFRRFGARRLPGVWVPLAEAFARLVALGQVFSGGGARRGRPGADRPAVRRDLGRRREKPLPAATSTDLAPGGGAALPPPCSAAQSRRRRETKAAPDRAEHLRAPGSRFVSPGTPLPTWSDCSGYPDCSVYPDSRTAMRLGVTRTRRVSRDTPHTRPPHTRPQAGTLAPKPGPWPPDRAPGPPAPGPGSAPGPGPGRAVSGSARTAGLRLGPPGPSLDPGQPLSGPVRVSPSRVRFGSAPRGSGSGQPLSGQDAQAPARGQPRSGSG